jgi:ectoine hydroxylase-related dioxygenase (phytanoyl-CoA dioxygenase family)
MMMPHLHDEFPIGPLSLKYMLDARFYPYVKAFLEEEPVGVQTMFYFKPPGARGQELHQDNFYLRVKPGTCAAAWIALDDADIENGGMKLVPGSQDYEIVCPEEADSSTSFTTDYVKPPPGTRAVHVDLKAGDVLFFNGSIIHGSSPNSSPTRFRRSLICHYIPYGSVVGTSYVQKPRLFDGSIVSVVESPDGGPCGTAQPMTRH